jgi:magnesium chelatase family protein
VREARERVRAAMINSGYEFPLKRITVNLAPAYLRKVGPAFDLPLAVALLISSGQLDPAAVESCAVVGELSLTGEIRPVRGALAVAEGARAHGLRRLVVPLARAREAALVPHLDVVGIESLGQLVATLRGDATPPPLPEPDPEPADDIADLADVRGHNGLIAGLEVAAAGGHNLFLQGPPGTGKTMLARRLPSVMPPLSPEEALEVTRIQSIAGLRGGAGLATIRPFRAPHHTISAACCSWTSSASSPARAWRRCASRWRTAT